MDDASALRLQFSELMMNEIEENSIIFDNILSNDEVLNNITRFCYPTLFLTDIMFTGIRAEISST